MSPTGCSLAPGLQYWCRQAGGSVGPAKGLVLGGASLCLGCRPAPTWNPGWVRLYWPHQPAGVSQACWCHPGSHGSSLSCSQTRGGGGGSRSCQPTGSSLPALCLQDLRTDTTRHLCILRAGSTDPTPGCWQGTGRTQVLLVPAEGPSSFPGSAPKRVHLTPFWFSFLTAPS